MRQYERHAFWAISVNVSMIVLEEVFFYGRAA